MIEDDPVQTIESGAPREVPMSADDRPEVQVEVEAQPATAESDADPAHRTVFQYVLGLIKQRGFKYSMVSVVNVLVGGGLLLLLQTIHISRPDGTTLELTATEANLISVMLSAIPAYYMNRAWVWGKRGKSHWKREVLPFWGFVVAGLILSTVAISFAQDHTENAFVILFVQLCAFGVLWVLRFFLLDRIFHLEADAPEDEDPDAPFFHHGHHTHA